MNLIMLQHVRGAFNIFMTSLVIFCMTTSLTSLVVSAEEDEPYIIHTYHVDITPLSPMYDVSGYVILFTKQDSGNDDAESSSTYLGYAGNIANIEGNLTDASCTELNGCGVHIHSGTSCFNSTTQGGHYYNNETIGEDPWIDARYFTNPDGVTSTFSGLLDIGTTDIEGHPFIVHSFNGTRIGCGMIGQKITDHGLLSTVTTELADSGVTSQVSIHTLGDGVLCYFGLATSLERNLASYLNPETSMIGPDCNFTNGCGVHVHNGTSCTNSTTQGGHYYGSDLATDPWLYTMYYTTDADGEGYYTGCVDTGITDDEMFVDRPFIVHSNNGSRVSCGMLQDATGEGGSHNGDDSHNEPTPTMPMMPTAPTPTMPSTSHASTILGTASMGFILTFMLSYMLI